MSLAYDETLRACCLSLGLDEPAPSPLSAIDRLQTEAELSQHGLVWYSLSPSSDRPPA